MSGEAERDNLGENREKYNKFHQKGTSISSLGEGKEKCNKIHQKGTSIPSFLIDLTKYGLGPVIVTGTLELLYTFQLPLLGHMKGYPDIRSFIFNTLQTDQLTIRRTKGHTLS